MVARKATGSFWLAVALLLASLPAVAQEPEDQARQPLLPRLVEPEIAADYMINLQSSREPPESRVLGLVSASPGKSLYVSRVVVDGTTWHRLRFGFFATEAEAAETLERLQASFPRAWIGRASTDEIDYANEAELSAGLTVYEAEPESIVLDAVAAGPELAPERIAALVEDGRQALLNEDYEQAVAIYSELAAAPGEHRAAAREFLGLSFERSGNLVRARAEYQLYLQEFGSGPDAVRVQQRLAGLSLRDLEPSAPLRQARVDSDGPWELTTGLAQYYREHRDQFDADQPERTTLSALFTDLDLYAVRAGTALDFSTRVTVSHMHDLLDESEGGRGDRQRVSYAYSEVASADDQWSVRIGRQTLYNWGVLGRFDGVHYAQRAGGRRQVHVTTGYPVESTRNSVEPDRNFYGVAIEFEDLFGDWDFATFINSQQIDGIDARNAVGAELQYFDERRSFSGTIDYDIDFGELNAVLLLGTWRLENRLTLSLLFDERKSPILNTRNALIGQPVSSVEELLLVWTSDEIRQIAVDRTADNQTVTLGLAAPLAERLQINFDVTRTELGGTIESAGVAATPEFGAQTYISTSLVGTGLFKGGDVNIFNIRVADSETFESQLLTWDARFPVGRRLRLNPRIRLSRWESLVDGRTRQSISPMLRLLINMRNRYRLEIEVGANHDVRKDTLGESEADGSFINLGYRASF